MRLLNMLVALWLAAAGLAAHGQPVAPSATAIPLTPISTLDVQRYLGRWHEIAKFPNRFQKKCVSDTSAEYSLMPDASLQVINRCRLQSGDIDQAIGQARQLGGASSARLQVRFAPAWLSFVPWVWGDYWVIDLDERYELAAVSEPGRDYLWILSHTPEVDAARYTALLARLSAMGFDVGRLEKTVHTDR